MICSTHIALSSNFIVYINIILFLAMCLVCNLKFKGQRFLSSQEYKLIFLKSGKKYNNAISIYFRLNKYPFHDIRLCFGASALIKSLYARKGIDQA